MDRRNFLAIYFAHRHLLPLCWARLRGRGRLSQTEDDLEE